MRECRRNPRAIARLPFLSQHAAQLARSHTNNPNSIASNTKLTKTNIHDEDSRSCVSFYVSELAAAEASS